MVKHEIYVEALLEYYYELDAKRGSGIYHLSDELLDLDTAIQKAVLTDKQREIIRLYYGTHAEQSEISSVLGISQPMVHKHAKSAIRKIANIYEQWEALEYAN
jgi:RNA polymerase sigma factor (sigma-70 family)